MGDSSSIPGAEHRRSFASRLTRRWQAFSAHICDFAMCRAMSAVHSRHRLLPEQANAFFEYIQECEKLTPEAYYAVPGSPGNEGPIGSGAETILEWKSPVQTPHPENNTCHVELFRCESGWNAPTVIFLHALMSASAAGYRQWAKRFNARGWNACFVHLPYHYSRTPKGFRNGELAISADLKRSGEGLRQGVIELRQLMQRLRAWGCTEFGLWATSYGGWIGSLLALMEDDFRFVALMAPIVEIEHAIWLSPATRNIRRELSHAGVTHDWIRRHYHLTSPFHRCPRFPEKVLLVAGEWDQISRKGDLASLRTTWSGSRLITVPQGHFGYHMMPTVFRTVL